MIDAHVHVWTLDPARYPWQQTLAHVPIPTSPATVEDLLAEMDRAGVAHAVLVQPSVYGWNNSYLCDCLERYPGRFAGVCLVDPHTDGCGDDLRYWCRARGCRGVRINIIADADATWLLGPTQHALWRVAAELGVSVAVQMRPHHAQVLSALAQKWPDVTFIADYLGGPAFHDGSGLSALDLLSQRPNVWYKVLSMAHDAREPYPFRDLWPLYQRAVERFGPTRLVFGTDFPHVRAVCAYPQAVAWLSALPFLDTATRTAISDSNARALWSFEQG